MRITVHYLAQLKRAAGAGTEAVEVAGPCTLGQLVATLGQRHDGAFRTMLAHNSLLYFVNDDHVDMARSLADGDEVSILAPMAGGAPQKPKTPSFAGRWYTMFGPLDLEQQGAKVQGVYRAGPHEGRGTEDLTIVSVILPQTIDASNTPQAMKNQQKYRISLDTNNSFQVQVTPELADGQIVRLRVNGQSVDNGWVKIDGGNYQDLTKTGDVTLRGTLQTRIAGGQAGGANAGNLRLAAYVRDTLTVFTPGFSVAAIPHNMTMTFDRLLTPANDNGQLGLRLAIDFKADSASESRQHLLGIHLLEKVQTTTGTGIFSNFQWGAATAYAPQASVNFDTHNTHSSVLAQQTAGNAVQNQVFVFRDRRTGAVDIPMTGSGFQITRNIALDQKTGKWTLRTAKVGANVTANGFSSSAGTTNPAPVDESQTL
jgi:molybdopterin converting factor small subunit